MSPNIILDEIKPGMRVLDVGAGSLELATMAVKQGAVVTAVDVREPAVIDSGITFVRSSIEVYSPAESFDVIIARNIFQFIAKETVLDDIIPKLLDSLRPSGTLIIETFSAPPSPQFPKIPTVSSFTLDELIIPRGNLHPAITFTSEGKEMRLRPDGTRQEFFFVECVLKY